MTVYYTATLLAVGSALIAQSLAVPDTVGPNEAYRQARAHARLFAYLTGAILATVAALRWRVGTDYGNYVNEYDVYAAAPWRGYTLLNEPGLRFIAKLSAQVNDDYATMLGAAAFITVGLSVATIYRTSPTFALSVLLYVLTGPWLGSFNGVRQYLACAVLFAGHRYILDRKFLKWLAVVLVAVLFHISAFVMVLLYLLPRRKLSLVGGVVVVALASLATEGYGRMLELVLVFRPDSDFSGVSYFVEELSPFRVAVAVAPLLFYALVTDKSELDQEDHFYVHLLLINAAVFIAASGSAYIARFAIYTGVFVCVAVPRLLPKKNRELRAVSMVGIVALYFVFWFVETVAIPDLATFRWIFDREPGQ